MNWMAKFTYLSLTDVTYCFNNILLFKRKDTNDAFIIKTSMKRSTAQ